MAIRVKTRAPIRLFTRRPDQVLFVRLSEPLGAFTSGDLRASDYSDAGYLYALDVPPGAYVAVACVEEMQRVSAGQPPAREGYPTRPSATSYTTYFPEDMIRATLVTVGPGEVVFMGEFVVDQDAGLDGADATQRSYYARFGRGDAIADALGGGFHYRGSMSSCSRDPDAREAFAAACRRHLVQAGWPPPSER